MADTFDVEFYVDDIEAQGDSYQFSSTGDTERWIGLSRVPVELVPHEARFAHAWVRASIELSEEPFDGATAIGDEEATVVAPLERQSSSAEVGLAIQTERGDSNGSLTLDPLDVPEWMPEEGDTGYIRLVLTYDHDRTLDEQSFSPKSADLYRGVFDPTTPGVVTRWKVASDRGVCSVDTTASSLIVGLRSVPFGEGASVLSLDAEHGETNWHTVVDGTYKMFVSAGDEAVYAATEDGPVYAFDAITGQQRWSSDIGGEIATSLAVAVGVSEQSESGGPRLFVGDEDCVLHALDADGTPAWTYQTSNSISSSPVASDGTVFCNDGSAVYAVEASSGNLAWKHEPGIALKKPSLLIDDSTVYVDDSEYVLTALDRETGAIEWTTETARSTWWSPPVMSERYVYVPTEAGGDGYDKDTDDLVRTLPGEEVVAVHDGQRYYSAGENTDRMFAASEASGRLAWQFNIHGLSIEQMVAANGVLYFVDREDGIYALETTGSTQLFVDGELRDFGDGDDETAQLALTEDGTGIGFLTYPSRYLPYYGDRVGTHFDVVVSIDTNYESVTGERQREAQNITEFTAAVTGREDGQTTLSLTEVGGEINGGRLQVPAERLPEDMQDVGDCGYVSVYLEVDEDATPEEAKPDEWY